MDTFSVSRSRPCEESDCGCGELMARKSDSATDQSGTYFINCDDGEDLRKLAVDETFHLCQAGHQDRKLYYDTWLVFYSRYNEEIADRRPM